MLFLQFLFLGFNIHLGQQNIQHGNKLVVAAVRLATEVYEGDIHQIAVWVWLQFVIALVDDMGLKGIIDDGVLLVLRAVHANTDAVDLLDIVILGCIRAVIGKLHG